MAASMDQNMPGSILQNNGVIVKQIDDIKGRGVFAGKNFQENDVLFRETPIVCAQFLWNDSYRYSACEFCMRSLETADKMAQRLSGNSSLVLPHPECCEVKQLQHTRCPQCQVAYCSSECQDKAKNAYHEVLCMGQSPPSPKHPLTILQDAWKSMHYPPESASITLIAKMIASIKQSRNKDDTIAQFNQFCQVPVNSEKQLAHKLLGEKFQGQLDILQGLLTNALFESCIETWFTADGLRRVFALIGMNGQGIGTSSLSVYVHNCDALNIPDDEREQLDSFIDQLYIDMEKESGSFLNCEGSGLYSLQSCCNHSCVANAEVRFNDGNSTLTVVALRDIEEGQEICINYLDECTRESSRHSRQKFLRENYLFECDCDKCKDQCDDPDETSSEEEEEDEDGMEEDAS
ncbi:protein-lysine N-trimethyltransferase SMYD5-like [Amphiura filiformis]|uniref:protein-lysine N-trimethyltransferase SMYD5-like n=1 Tax=Amphiura filiformis TaxID=82378 RepID=UPI003B221E87